MASNRNLDFIRILYDCGKRTLAPPARAASVRRTRAAKTAAIMHGPPFGHKRASARAAMQTPVGALTDRARPPICHKTPM
jgi:hypothetical protein